MNHFNDAYSSSEFSIDLFTDLISKFKHPESFLSSDGKVGLILIETYMNYLLIFMVHFGQCQVLYKSMFLNYRQVILISNILQKYTFIYLFLS